MRTLYDTYKEIKVYEGLAITEDMVNSMINSGSGYRAVYEDVHKRMLKNYAGLDINKYPASTFKYQYALRSFQIQINQMILLISKRLLRKQWVRLQYFEKRRKS